MRAYFRSRGGQVDGSFVEDQILAMWEAGHLLGTDQLCVQGKEQWKSAESVVNGLKVRMEVAQSYVLETHPQRAQSWSFVVISLFIGVGSIFGSLWMGFFLAVIGLPIAIVVFLGGLFIDRVVWVCGSCGNRVERISAVCPACRAMLR